MTQAAPTRPPGADFWKFLVGQALSQLGSAFTLFALPLLVFKRSGSALDMGFTAAFAMLPYLLFGLVFGAWVDRSNRKRLMVLTDLGRAAIVASVPALALAREVPIEWLYAVAFLGTTLTILFEAGEFAAVPSLAHGADLNVMNGRIQASYAVAGVAGPLLAGVLVAFVPVATLMIIDAATFVISAVTLATIRADFNAEEAEQRTTTLLADVREGLRYVLGQPVLRNIAWMMALTNLLLAAANAQLVLLIKSRWHTSDADVGWFYAAAGLGVVVLSFTAGPLRRRLPYGVVGLGALGLSGLLILGIGLSSSYGLCLALWALEAGAAAVFNIVTGSLRQAIVPNDLLGRVMTIASVLAWSSIPIGAIAGGAFIERTGDVGLAYAAVGAAMVAVAGGFAFTAVGRAARHLEAARPTGRAPG